MKYDYSIFAAVFKKNDGDGERVEYFNMRDLENADMNRQQAEEYATELLMQDGEYLDDVIEEESDVSLDTVAEVTGEVLQNLRDSGVFDIEDGEQPEMMMKLERLVVSLSAYGYDYTGA